MSQISEIPEKEMLTEADLWRTNAHPVWKARRFESWPHFYPVFKWQNYYSFSPLCLARLKGDVKFCPEGARVLAKLKVPYSPPDILIDREIRRVGRPRPFNCELKNRESYLERLAAAIQADAAAVEAMNPGFTNFILCGGKDSLNGLLLGWKNPVVVLSAEPNYDLVRGFIRVNGLQYDLVKLKDYVDPSQVDLEVAENFCRIDLQHNRWAPHLAKIAREAGRRAIFWMGSMGESYMTAKWMKYTANRHPLNVAFRTRYRGLARPIGPLRKLGWKCGIRKDVERTFWRRGAVWQGNIIALYRSITGCLTQSLYHGPETASVLHESDLAEISYEDIRPQVGYMLAGRKIEYPRGNPMPRDSFERAGLSSVERFAESLKSLGLPMIYS